MMNGWKKSKYPSFGDAWEKVVGLNPKDCQHSEREGDYCPHCETGHRTIELYILDDQAIGSPNYGLWYVSVSRTGKKWFKTKSQALAYAKDYMRKH
jgi:hypothetical protein